MNQSDLLALRLRLTMKTEHGWGREIGLKYLLPAGLLVGLLAGTLYSLPGDVEVINTVSPKNSGTFPVVRMSDVQGGYRSVADVAARNAIPAARRVTGMLVETNSDGKTWRYLPDGGWVEQVSAATTPDGGYVGTYFNIAAQQRFFQVGVIQTIYVRTGGSDTICDGTTTATSPGTGGHCAYATIPRAILDVPQGWLSKIIVDVGPMTIAGDTSINLTVTPGTPAPSSANMPGVVIVGDCTTPVVTLTTTNVGTAVVNNGITKLAQFTFPVGPYVGSIGEGTHWLKQTSAVTGLPTAVATTRTSASPNLVLIATFSTAKTNVSVCPFTTSITGRLWVNGTLRPDRSYALSVVGISASYVYRVNNAYLYGMQLTSATSMYFSDAYVVYSAIINPQRVYLGGSIAMGASTYFYGTLFSTNQCASSAGTLSVQTGLNTVTIFGNVFYASACGSDTSMIYVGQWYHSQSMIPYSKVTASISSNDFELTGAWYAISVTDASAVTGANTYDMPTYLAWLLMHAYVLLNGPQTGKVGYPSGLFYGSRVTISTGGAVATCSYMWQIQNTVNPGQDWYIGQSGSPLSGLGPYRPLLSTQQLPYHNGDTGDVFESSAFPTPTTFDAPSTFDQGVTLGGSLSGEVGPFQSRETVQVQDGGYLDAGHPSTSYSNPGGQGDRRDSLTVTYSLYTPYYPAPPSKLVDGLLTNAFSWGIAPTAGQYLRFDFGPYAQKLIQEVTIYSSGAYAQGVWQWQRSPDCANFTSVGSPLTWNAATQVDTDMAADNSPARCFQYLGVSGNTSSGPWIREVTFKITDWPFSQVTNRTIQTYGNNSPAGNVLLEPSAGYVGIGTGAENPLDLLSAGLHSAFCVNGTGRAMLNEIVPRGQGVHPTCTASSVWYQNTADAGTDQTLCFCKQVAGVWTPTCL